MTFKDLFVPKWKHSEINVRKEAVKKLSSLDQNTILIIARTDTCADIRREAVKKLKNDGLAIVARTDPDKEVRKEAVKRISDFTVLAEIARKDKDKEVREVVVDSLKNKEIEILAGITTMITNKAGEQLVNAHNSEKELLLEMAKMDNDEEVRIKAIRKIWDKKALEEVVKTFNDKNIQIEALRRITDEKSGTLSVNGIQNLLIEIAKSDLDSDIRQEVVKHLKDNTMLVQFARTDTDQNVRLEAVKRINDKDVLIDIAKYDTDYSIRQIAVESYYFDDQDALAYIARNDESEIVRLKALNNCHLNDQTLLADIARNDKSNFVRKSAIRKLNNQELLVEFVVYDKDIDIAATAYKELQENHPVRKEILSTTNLNVRWLELLIAHYSHENSYDGLKSISSTLLVLLERFGPTINVEHLTKMMNLKDATFSVHIQSDYSWDQGTWEKNTFSMEEVRKKSKSIWLTKQEKSDKNRLDF